MQVWKVSIESHWESVWVSDWVSGKESPPRKHLAVNQYPCLSFFHIARLSQSFKDQPPNRALLRLLHILCGSPVESGDSTALCSMLYLCSFYAPSMLHARASAVPPLRMLLRMAPRSDSALAPPAFPTAQCVTPPHPTLQSWSTPCPVTATATATASQPVSHTARQCRSQRC